MTGNGAVALATGREASAAATSAGGVARAELAGHVRWCAIDGAVFVLDTRAGDYHALPPDAGRPWFALFGGETPDDVGVASLLAVLRRRGWLADGAEVQSNTLPASHRQPRFAWLDACSCLVRAAWKLRLGGFSAAYGWAASAVRPAGAPRTALPEALAAFHRAERLVLSRRGLDDCLPRSLALFVFLRRAGFAVRHQIGVKRYPFSAHAWVEHGAAVLLDTPVSNSGFVPLAALG